MATWPEFAEAAPGLAGAVQALVLGYGAGLGYLATVRADGGPRVHPVSPLITGDGLFCFVVRSPKRDDLERDGRYALHSFPPADVADEAHLTGRAYPLLDGRKRRRFMRDHRATAGDWRVFEFTVETAMVAHYPTESAWPPTYSVWRDPSLDLGASRVGA